MPVQWIVFLGLIAFFTFTGPFGTFEQLALPARFAYWGLLFVGGWVLVLSVIGLCLRAAEPLIASLVASLAAAPLIALLLVAIDPLFFPEVARGSFAQYFIYTLPMFLAVTLAVQFLVSKREASFEVPSTALRDDAQAFVDKLPANKRAPLISITVQDHYLEVTTEAGSELILMRMKDAVELLGPGAGQQIHRSHWVAARAVTYAKRVNERWILSLTDGRTLPVSRTFLADVKARGWI